MFETGDFEAWQEVHIMDISYDEEDWLEETWEEEDDVDIRILEAQLDNNSTVTMDEGENSVAKVSIPEWIFLIINILTELLSAAFDQLSSVNKPRYALIAMLMSFVAAITCIIELAYKAGKERVNWRWESKLPWFYHSSPNHNRFGTFPEMIGLVCVILQTISSVIAYTFYLQHANYPLNVCLWPLVFAMGLFCSKFK